MSRARLAPGLSSVARATVWTLGAWAAVQLVAGFLDRNALMVAEWAAGQLAVTWSDPLVPPPSGAAIGRRFGTGAACGAVAAIAVVGLALATRRASIELASPTAVALLFGLLSPLLGAVRDELLLRGMVLQVARSVGGYASALALCGAAAAAARLGAEHSTTMGVAVEGLRGVALGALWTRDRGAWMALGANAAWTWALDSLTRGDLLDVRMGAVEPGASSFALAAAAVAAVLAAEWGRRARRP